LRAQQSHSSIRIQAGIGLVALLSLVSALDYYRQVTQNAVTEDPFRIAEQQERFRGVAAAIPPESLVGYLSDLPETEARGGLMFVGAQYALAPALVVPLDRTPKAEWVLGNFSQPVAYGEIGRQHGLKIARDFGFGVVLYRR
jgi:hypothetical protein